MPSYANDLPVLPPFLTHMRALQVGAIKLHLMETDEARAGPHTPTNVGFCIIALLKNHTNCFNRLQFIAKIVGLLITLVKYDNRKSFHISQILKSILTLK